MINAMQIKPVQRGKSDFFSWQLYRFLKKHPESIQIWEGTWNWATGIDPENTTLYIGLDREGGWIHARHLRNLCTYGADLSRYAYGPGHDTENWKNVTERFWDDYLRIGVCAIHEDYAHNWIEKGDFRHCTYCLRREVKKTRQAAEEYWETA